MTNMSNYNILGAVKRCYWTLALLVMTGGMAFSVYALTAAYLSYPIDVSISVHHEPQLVFPAVTICNMSPVTKSALEAADLSGASKRRKKRAAEGGKYPSSLSSSSSSSFIAPKCST